MALVRFILGACPACKRADSFGNIDVYKSHVIRGCKQCRYRERVDLPPVNKKLMYLDQYFFSHAFRAGDSKFLDAAAQISKLVDMQLLSVPYSTVHEDETHQWEHREELMSFIKATARGAEFRPDYEVESTQLINAFGAWLKGSPSEYIPERADAIRDDVDTWDGYYRIEIGRYMGDIELIRDLKSETTKGLLGLFAAWRKATSTFNEDCNAEFAASGRSYIDSFFEYVARIAGGDDSAMFNAPIQSMVLQSLLHCLPSDTPDDERLKRCAQFLFSDHFRSTPYQWLNAHILATLKATVREGAYTNADRAQKRLNGFFYDLKHIATYAPYVDAFLMDAPMAELVARQTIGLEKRFGVRVFSRSNWNEMLTWLAGLEQQGLTDEHRAGLAAAYPGVTI